MKTLVGRVFHNHPSEMMGLQYNGPSSALGLIPCAPCFRVFCTLDPSAVAGICHKLMCVLLQFKGQVAF